MFNSLQNIAKKLYIVGLAGLISALPISNFFMSFFQFFILGAWILEWEMKAKLKSLLSNPTPIILSSLYVLHVIGLLWTSDYNYAFNDLRIKLPLLMLPIVISTGTKINQKTFNVLLILFVTSVTIATFFCTNIYIFDKYKDIRDISIFISHIRFALLICLAIFILLYFYFQQKQLYAKAICLLTIIWLILFIYILNSLTGLIILWLTSIFTLLYLYNKKHNTKFVYAIIILTFLPIIYILFIGKAFIKEPQTNNFQNLAKYTLNGNPYIHDTTSRQTENGNLIYLYINVKELKQEWNKRSNIPYDGTTKKEQKKIQDVLIRYLTSKGLSKDSLGMTKLNNNDIKAIENGITNYLLLSKYPLRKQIYQVIWEYQYYKHTKNPSGHSVTQRIEYLKAALNIIKKNILIGVGTGDLQKEFDNYYEISKSQLDKQWRLRAHNQYITLFVAFGIIGFIWFLFAIIYPVIKHIALKDYFFYVFFIISTLSMINEDTLETQAGVTFFAFFFSFFLYARKQKNNEIR